MKRRGATKKNPIYRAPVLYVGFFYTLLLVWTVVCVYLLGSKAIKVGWPVGQLLMIAFVVAYTWYFSLGISYRLMIGDNGDVQLTSIRRVLNMQVQKISGVEGPRFAIMYYGFIRFRLEREKAYLFSLITDTELQKILSAMRRANREITFKGL